MAKFTHQGCVPSGNSGVDFVGRGKAVVYDRGELLWLIARSVIEQDACVEEARATYQLTDQEVCDVLSMSD